MATSTFVAVDGVNVSAAGVSLASQSDTNYSELGHLSTLIVDGETATTLSDSGVTVGADGLTLDTQDNSSLSASSVAPDFDPSATQESGGAADSGPSISVDRTTAVISFDKDTTALISDSTVESAGVVRVQAVDNVTLSSETVMAANATSSTSISVSGGGGLAVNLVNGAISASIQGSAVTTSGGDVQVLAGDSSSVSSRAETNASATGTSTAAALAGTVALNAIGWSFGTGIADLLAASVGTILGTNSFWTDNAPANVTSPGDAASVSAFVSDSTIAASAAFLVQAIAAATINSTVTNVSSATATASGNGVAVAVGGVAASNRVSRAAMAFLNNVQPASRPGAGAVTVNAQNNAAITSNSTLVTSAVATTADAKTTYVSSQTPGNAKFLDDGAAIDDDAQFRRYGALQGDLLDRQSVRDQRPEDGDDQPRRYGLRRRPTTRAPTASRTRSTNIPARTPRRSISNSRTTPTPLTGRRSR